MRDCKTCARADWSKGEGNGCTAWSCDYINKDDAIKAYEDRENGVLEEVVHCPDCRECAEHSGHANCGGYLYCKVKRSLVTETDYCSWGERK